MNGVVALALACVLGACGEEPLAPTVREASNEPGDPVIMLLDDVPQPGYLVVPYGVTVEWRNAGTHDHSVSTYGTPDEWEDALLEPGQSFRHGFSQPGEYAYICIVHGEVGTVVVVEDSDGDLSTDDY